MTDQTDQADRPWRSRITIRAAGTTVTSQTAYAQNGGSGRRVAYWRCDRCAQPLGAGEPFCSTCDEITRDTRCLQDPGSAVTRSAPHPTGERDQAIPPPVPTNPTATEGDSRESRVAEHPPRIPGRKQHMTTLDVTPRPFGMRFLQTAPADTGTSVEQPAYDPGRQLSVTSTGDPWTTVVGAMDKESTTVINHDGRETDYTDPY